MLLPAQRRGFGARSDAVNRVAQGKADHYSSDCPMAGHQIASGLSEGGDAGAREPEHPMSLIRKAYGI